MSFADLSSLNGAFSTTALCTLSFGLNENFGGLKSAWKYGILGVNKGLFTDGCKKLQKYAQIVKEITQKRMVFVEEFKDINVMIAVKSLAQKEDQKIYKKLSSKSMYIRDKY